MQFPKFPFLFLSLSIILFILSCDSNKAIAPEDKYADAKSLFTTNCSSCHGAEMRMFVDRKWNHGNTEDSIAMSITSGYIDLGMPSFDSLFNEDQIKDLASYIRYGIDNTEEFTFDNPFNADSTYNIDGVSFTLELISDEIEVPWGFVFLPDNQMLITDMDGEMFRRDLTGALNPISNVPSVLDKGQGGLLDVELDPDYAENKIIYISYSKLKMEDDKELVTTALSKAVLEGDALVNVEEIFEALPYLPTKHHYGGRIEFDNGGYMFISVGDRGRRDDNPQSLENHSGKIHRINSDGSIPADNPFVGQEKAIESIYSYGHRNPQGLVFDKSTNKLWEHEHGPRGGDELNIIQKGENYGWPVVSFGINYNGTIFTSETEMEGMANSEKVWVPSIAPCGMAQVTSDKYPGWENDILVGSLRFKYLAKVSIDEENFGQETPLLKNIGRMRNVRLDNEGYIYISTELPGKIYKLIPVEEAL